MNTRGGKCCSRWVGHQLDRDAPGRPADYSRLPDRTDLRDQLQRCSMFPGRVRNLDFKTDTNGTKLPYWFGNPGAFQQPCQLGVNPATRYWMHRSFDTGAGYLGGYNTTTTGPGFHRFDFSTFKKFQFSERFSMQFRAEFFNILNHPNFNAPGFGGNGVVSIGGSPTSHSSQLRRNWFDARCSIRSEADSICSETVLLG